MIIYRIVNGYFVVSSMARNPEAWVKVFDNVDQEGQTFPPPSPPSRAPINSFCRSNSSQGCRPGVWKISDGVQGIGSLWGAFVLAQEPMALVTKLSIQ